MCIRDRCGFTPSVRFGSIQAESLKILVGTQIFQRAVVVEVGEIARSWKSEAVQGICRPANRVTAIVEIALGGRRLAELEIVAAGGVVLSLIHI